MLARRLSLAVRTRQTKQADDGRRGDMDTSRPAQAPALSRPFFWTSAALFLATAPLVPTVVGLLGQALIAIPAVTVICIARCCCSEAPAPVPALEPTDAEQTKGDTSAAPRPATKPPRLLFLDNLNVSIHCDCCRLSCHVHVCRQYNVGNYYSSFHSRSRSRSSCCSSASSCELGHSAQNSALGLQIAQCASSTTEVSPAGRCSSSAAISRPPRSSARARGCS